MRVRASTDELWEDTSIRSTKPCNFLFLSVGFMDAVTADDACSVHCPLAPQCLASLVRIGL